MAQESYSTIKTLAEVLGGDGMEPGFRVSILNERQLAIGPAASPRAFIFDLSTEHLTSEYCGNNREKKNKRLQFDMRALPSSKAQRTTGRYTFSHGDTEFARNSLADLMEAVLIYLEEIFPGTIEKLSTVKKRTRRIVAKNKSELFDKSHLVKDHSRMIGNGWWMGTNNSGLETKKWIRSACDVAGLDPVSDIIIGIP